MIDPLHDGPPSEVSPFAGVLDFALAGLETMKADLVRAGDPEVTIEFAIDGRHMFVGDREVCELLGAITTTIPKGCMTLYCIAPRDTDERAAQVIRDFFTESKRRGDGRSRDNQRLSSVLYVGTSRKMATRTKEHLGFCSRSTYGLKLSEWYPAADLPLRLTCSVFPPGTSGTVVSVLEDALWERLRPMFGRKGAR